MRRFLFIFFLMICSSLITGCVPEERWAPFSGPWPPGATHASNGTGILLGDGFIVTAAHVTRNCITTTIATESGKSRAVPVEVKAIAYDRDTLGRDIALLQTRDRELMDIPPANFVDLWPDDVTMATVSSTDPALTPPAKVSLIGFPIGTIPTTPATVPVTYLTAQKLSGSQGAHVWAFLGNAAPGFSGAPVADEKGNVVGITFKGVAAGDPETVAKQVPGGVGLAVASRDIIDFVKANGVAISSSRPDQASPKLEESLVEVFCFR